MFVNPFSILFAMAKVRHLQKHFILIIPKRKGEFPKGNRIPHPNPPEGGRESVSG